MPVRQLLRQVSDPSSLHDASARMHPITGVMGESRQFEEVLVSFCFFYLFIYLFFWITNFWGKSFRDKLGYQSAQFYLLLKFLSLFNQDLNSWFYFQRTFEMLLPIVIKRKNDRSRMRKTVSLTLLRIRLLNIHTKWKKERVVSCCRSFYRSLTVLPPKAPSHFTYLIESLIVWIEVDLICCVILYFVIICLWFSLSPMFWDPHRM